MDSAKLARIRETISSGIGLEGVDLRRYQRNADLRVLDEVATGHSRVLLVAPTGSGKTVMFAAIAAAFHAEGLRVLVIAHRRELISQAVSKLNKHGIANVGVYRGGKGSTNRDSMVQVAAIQALKPGLIEADLVVIDECFPAGTLIDGRLIESIQAGDIVRSFNHDARAVEHRVVKQVFRTPVVGKMATVYFSDGTWLTCTEGHPIFTREGYVPAVKIVGGMEVLREEDSTEEVRRVRHCVHSEVVERRDDPHVFSDVQEEEARREAPRRCDVMRAMHDFCGVQGTVPLESPRGDHLLLSRVQRCGEVRIIVSDDGGDESQARVQEDDGAQPDGDDRSAHAHDEHASPDEVETDRNGREGEADGCSSEDARRRSRVAYGGNCSDSSFENGRECDSLLSRHRQQGRDGRSGGGRRESFLFGGAGAGRKEGRVLTWRRVDRVEIHERRSDGGFGPLCPDGHVYNFEVDGNHNYFAEGVLVHNCHHAPAASYARLREMYPDAVHIGATATPWWGDAKGLGDYFQTIVIAASVRELTELGYLAPVRVFTHPHTLNDLDLRGIKTMAGEYSIADASERVDRPKLVGNIVEHWKSHARNARTLAFAASITHSHHIVDQFASAGIAAEHVDGDTPDADRDAILARLRSGETRVVSNFNVLTEGFDAPEVGCIILARPTKRAGVFMQAVGRGVRASEEKSSVVILDHAGSCLAHGMPDADRVVSLDGLERSPRGEGKTRVRHCPLCGETVNTGVRECPSCSKTFGYSVLTEDPIGILVEATMDNERGTLLTLDGKTMTVAAWARELGISPLTVYSRLHDGWSVEKALAPPRKVAPVMILEIDGRSQTVGAWSRETGVSINTIKRRLELGYSEKDAIAKTTAESWKKNRRDSRVRTELEKARESVASSPTVGGKIALARLEKGWSQTQLAERACVSVNAVSNVERGIDVCSEELIQKIQEAVDGPTKEFPCSCGHRPRNGEVIYVPLSCSKNAVGHRWGKFMRVAHGEGVIRCNHIAAEVTGSMDVAMNMDKGRGLIVIEESA